MHQIQRQRTTEALRSQGIHRALFANLDTVKWLTGFAPLIELGNWHFFAGGPALVWYEDGHFTLIALDVYSDLAKPLLNDPDMTVEFYTAYTIEQPITSTANLAEVFQRVLQRSTGSGKFGIEMHHLTATLYLTLMKAPGMGDTVEFTELDPFILPLRMIKTDEELTKLRYNFALTDLGHQVARQETRVGQREIDVWSAVHEAINRQAGQRVPLGNDCVVNYRKENNIGGLPDAYPIRPGDSLIVDLSTIHQGYWSDSCMTYYPGEPTAEQAKAHRMIQEALEYAISLVRPGVVAKDLDQKVRAFIQDAGYPVYPHHTGHGVGASAHEAPRIVPYNNEVLQAGMVIMLEPGTYVPGEFGVRLEDALLITADGAEVLTTHAKNF